MTLDYVQDKYFFLVYNEKEKRTTVPPLLSTTCLDSIGRLFYDSELFFCSTRDGIIVAHTCDGEDGTCVYDAKFAVYTVVCFC